MIIDGWYCCPKCKKKLFKLKDGFIAKNIEVYCRQCRIKIDVEIEDKKRKRKRTSKVMA